MRLIRILAWLVGALVLLIAGAWWAARPILPDAFYVSPRAAASQPGVLLRQEPFERNVPTGARAWRILYTTTIADDRPAVASAIVMASRKTFGEPRPVVAWAHGTTGVVPGCAPSVLDNPFPYVPALASLLDRGWIYVATDYAGQGTSGTYPHLIGEGEARSVLDSVRAARQLNDIRISDKTVVWGHSQGGHASLWTGIVAPKYAPDVPLAGVVAIAPATDLPALLEAIQHTPAGRVMSSLMLEAYGRVYPELAPESYVSKWMHPIVQDMAGRCLVGRKVLFSVAEGLATRGSIFRVSPSSGVFGERLAQNVPNQTVQQPLLIAQGLADALVLPSIQAEFVRRRCDAGQALELREYAGRDHLSVLAANSPLIPELLRWTQARFDGSPAPDGCRRE